MTKSRMLVISLLAVTFMLSACGNTLDGAGRDIEGAGEWMQNTF